MVRKELMSYVGSAQQLMSVRPVVYKEGRAEGLQAYEVKNDRLSFSVMIDKCLDIAEVNWKGYNISFLSKPGRNVIHLWSGKYLCTVFGRWERISNAWKNADNTG